MPFPFRFSEESIRGILFRYDRFTRTVEQRFGYDKNSLKWVPMPQFEDLKHLSSVLVQQGKNRQIWAIEEQTEELRRQRNEGIINTQETQNAQSRTDKWEKERKDNELKRSVEDIKETLEAEKREREYRDRQRGFR